MDVSAAVVPNGKGLLWREVRWERGTGTVSELVGSQDPHTQVWSGHSAVREMVLYWMGQGAVTAL